jgi:SAM-dependent methyltransferase
MDRFSIVASTPNKIETRLIPELESRSLYIKHLKAYQFMSGDIEEASVLDAGCGDGYGSAYLARFAKSVIGVDYDKKTVSLALEKYKAGNLRYMHRDVTEFDFKDNEFDFVCSFQVIEHIPEEKIFDYLKELKRVLKNNGRLYLSTPNLEKMMKNKLTYKKNPAHCREFRFSELKDALSRVFSEFEIFGVYYTPKFMFYLILKKSGIFKYLPPKFNPVKRFYDNISLDDFSVGRKDREQALDFICICKK